MDLDNIWSYLFLSVLGITQSGGVKLSVDGQVPCDKDRISDLLMHELTAVERRCEGITTASV